MRRLFATTRYFIVLAIICTFIGATILLISGALVTFHTVVDFIKNPPDNPGEVKHLLLASIEAVDIFLVAMVMYVIVGVVATALGVLFLGEAVGWDGSRNLLAYGVGIAAMIIELTYFMTSHAGSRD